MQEINEVDAYIQALPPDRSAALTALRNLVRETLPEARETMRYRMPTYELDEVVCSFASQKHYMSLYLDSGLVEENRIQWGKLDVGKSCVRFKRLEDLPLQVVCQILVRTIEKQSSL